MSVAYLINTFTYINLIINLGYTYGKLIDSPILLSEDDASPLKDFNLSNTYINTTYIRGIVDREYAIYIEFRATDNLRWDSKINKDSFNVKNSYNLGSRKLLVTKIVGEKHGTMILKITQEVPCTSENNTLSFTYNNLEIPITVELQFKYTYLDFIYQGENKTICNLGKRNKFENSYEYRGYCRYPQIYIDFTILKEDYDRYILLSFCEMKDLSELCISYKDIHTSVKNESEYDTTFSTFFTLSENNQYFIIVITLKDASILNCVNINFYMKNRDNKEEDKAVDDNKDDNNGPNYILIISIIISALIIIFASILVYKKLKAKKEEKLEKDIREMQSAKGQVAPEQEITNKPIKFKN